MKKFRSTLALMGAVTIAFFTTFSSNVNASNNAGNKIEDNVETEINETQQAKLDLYEKYAGQYIPQGVSIGGIDVSYMTFEEADAVVENLISKYDDAELTLVAGKKQLKISGSDLSITTKNSIVEQAMNYGKTGNILEKFLIANNKKANKDFSVSISCDLADTIKFLEINKDKLSDGAKDNTIVRENGAFKFVEGKAGEGVDADTSAAIICNFITNEWDGQPATIQLSTEIIQPRGTKDELMKVKDLLGTYTTDFASSSSNRKGNVITATAKLDGKLLYPGDEYYVYPTVEPFTTENGYFEAVGYENGKAVPSMGGGACQVSTTFYNAAIRAELEIVKRYAHSMIVDYVYPAEDAAISEWKDLILKNNKNYPVYIEALTKNNKIIFNVYGVEDRPANRTIEFVPEINTVTILPNQYVADEKQGLGYLARAEGIHIGYTATLYKVVKVDGKEESREVFNRSSYMPTAAVWHVGVGSDSEEAKEEMIAAVKSQNQVYIDSIAARYGSTVNSSTPGYVKIPKQESEVVVRTGEEAVKFAQ